MKLLNILLIKEVLKVKIKNMYNKQIKISFNLILLIFLTNYSSYCQSISESVISSTGDFYTNANTSLSWTLGECVTETFNATNNIITQGFQQYYYSVTAVENCLPDEYNIYAYPNPASNFINICFDLPVKKDVFIELFDINGNKLFSKSSNSKNNFQIDITTFSSSIYFLKIIENKDKLLKTFKIIKL